MKYASVLLNLPYEATYSYIIPESLQGEELFGKRAVVPFGRRRMTGFIVATGDEKPEGDYELKAIERMIDKTPVFTHTLLDIAYWMKTMYFSPPGLNLSMMIPSGRRESEVSPFYEASSFSPIETLSQGQEHALHVLRTSSSRVFYIFGITGSGKSEVYLRRAEDVIKEGKQVLYMVPEITLSEQLSDEVYSRFSGRVAILHSSLTPSQRLKAWNEIMNGEIDIVIGARSSVFAPFKNLGLIIIDEEHETSYKSGNAPRYHARQIAEYRSAKENAILVMGSATPSLEAWNMMDSRRIRRIDMRERIGEGKYPHVEIVNSLKEKRNITPALEEAIRKTLAAKRGVILFLNRRGYTYNYVCSECGHVITCPNCSVSMTYHKKEQRLVCHTCGFSEPLVTVCPECRSRDLQPHGFGTENVEEEVKALFPFARIARLDTDTAEKKGRTQEILQGFRNGHIDILLGTQMIAKGLNFPLVSLVGVLNADSSLSIPDFRASERTFCLLHQVAGRAGRYRDDGYVIIQTTQPFAPAISAILDGGVEQFYKNEIAERKATLFPPFSRLLNLTVRGKNEEKVSECASSLETEALTLLKNGRWDDIEIFSASPCLISRKAQYYRYHVLLRSSSASQILNFGHTLLDSFKLPSSLHLEIDMDPVSLM
ncbi:MAG: primosomal protein N' [Spirochaetes bacterium]|uniref:Replication restart protein PriA n=1 Tax=Candidatus Ornithospirochaeta stercoripullorum TaxID=2840899 RepID=A0A9D9E246_9SPIO|nr:primosomal protein N' [Candidatus Ornithospirochaeta stercoripullorum]